MWPDVAEANEKPGSAVHIGVLLDCSHRVQQVAFVICDINVRYEVFYLEDLNPFSVHNFHFQVTFVCPPCQRQYKALIYSHFQNLKRPSCASATHSEWICGVLVAPHVTLGISALTVCCQPLWRRLLTCELLLKRRRRKRRLKSTRKRWPSGQEELPGLQLVLVVEHHGVHPGYGTVLRRGTTRIRMADWLWGPSASSHGNRKRKRESVLSFLITIVLRFDQ